MTERSYFWLAWSLFAAVVIVLLAGLLLWTPNREFFLFFLTISLPFAVVGALVASRRTHNPVGWLFLVFGLIAAIVASSQRYAEFALVAHPGSLPAGEWVAWFAAGIWHPAFGFFVFAFLFFPDGRLPSPRWRPVAYFALFVYAFGAILGLLWNPLFTEFTPGIEAPLDLPYAKSAEAAFGVFLLCNFVLLFLSMVSLVVRLRRSSGIERRRLGLFVYAVAVFAIAFPASVWYFGDGRVIAYLLTLVPVSAGIAILRHRLFDIDLVVNRTLVYLSLTVLLTSIYFGSVTALQYVFRLATGEETQVVIVASTLAIAAMFVPLRRRLQTFVDRRFYRSRYDARVVASRFALRLRDEVELSSLDRELLAIVHETVHPTHASLWLKTPETQKNSS